MASAGGGVIPDGMHLEEDESRQVALYAATCVRRALPVFEVARPDDPRPRDVLCRFPSPCRGRGRFGELLNALDAELRK